MRIPRRHSRYGQTPVWTPTPLDVLVAGTVAVFRPSSFAELGRLTGLTDENLSLILDRLRENGYLATSARPNISLSELPSVSLPPPKGGRGGGPGARKVKETTVTEEDKAIARRLEKMIQLRHKVNHTSSLAAWSAIISRQRRRDGISTERMHRVLRLLEDPVARSHQFCPVVDSAGSFREKFVKIENFGLREGLFVETVEEADPDPGQRHRRQRRHRGEVFS